MGLSYKCLVEIHKHSTPLHPRKCNWLAYHIWCDLDVQQGNCISTFTKTTNIFICQRYGGFGSSKLMSQICSVNDVTISILEAQWQFWNQWSYLNHLSFYLSMFIWTIILLKLRNQNLPLVMSMLCLSSPTSSFFYFCFQYSSSFFFFFQHQGYPWTDMMEGLTATTNSLKPKKGRGPGRCHFCEHFYEHLNYIYKCCVLVLWVWIFFLFEPCSKRRIFLGLK